MQLKHPHVRQWEARSANIEGKGEISIRFLVETALRSRPDIVIIGEVRGAEAYDCLLYTSVPRVWVCALFGKLLLGL